MGFVNNLAGAGGVLALLAFDVAGLPPQVANASMRPAALAIAGAGAVGFRSRGQVLPRKALAWAAMTVPGAVLGTWLAIEMPEWVYEATLLGVVTVLTVQLLRPGRPVEDRRPAGRIAQVVWFSLLGLHMGFVQVGAGLLAILALSHVHSRDLVHVNVAKMALVAVSAGASILGFSTAGAIHWAAAGWLALGAGVGSFLASRFSVAKGSGMIRLVVLAICGVMMLRIGYRLFVA